jgi:hypothetical protein
MERDIITHLNLKLETSSFGANYHFLTEIEFNLLCEKLKINECNTNFIKNGCDLYIKINGNLNKFGNTIGFLIGRYIDENKDGYKNSDFILGIREGISIAKGTNKKLYE